MADFRQNAPRIDTQVTGESYSSNAVSTTANVLGAAASTFSTLVTGLDAAKKREMAAADEARAQSAELRAQEAAARQRAEYEQTLRERGVADDVALGTDQAEMAVMMGTLGSQYGIDFGGADPSQYTPEQLESVIVAAQERTRIEDIASGTGRGSQLANILKRVQLSQRIRRDSTLAAEYMQAFGTITGGTASALTNDVMETAQAREIARAEAVIKQREEYRKSASIPPSWNDSQVDEHMESLRRASERVAAAQRSASIASSNETIRAINSAKTRTSLTNDVHLLAVEGVQAFYSEVNNTVKQRGTPLTPGEITTYTNRAAIARSQLVQRLARSTNSTPAEIERDFPILAQLESNFVDYVSGKTSKEVVEARLATSRAINQSDILNRRTPDGRTVGQLVAESEIIKDIVPDNLSPNAQLEVERTLLPYTQETLAALFSGTPHAGLTTQTQGTQINFGSRGRNPLGGYLDVATGRNLPRQGAGNPTGRPGATSLRDVQLSPGRSLLNVPAPLRANVGVSRSLNNRLDSLNTQLMHLNWNSDVSRTDAFAEFIRTAADPQTVGTFLVDPKIAEGVTSALTEYTRRTIIAMNEDLGRETGNRMLGGYPSMQYSIPVAHGNSAGFGNGVVMQERADGGVYFVVDPELNDRNRLAEASRLADLFNKKYAKPIQQIVRAWSHLRQDDPFDYRTALATVANGGAALGGDIVGGAVKRAAARIVADNNGQISLDEAIEIVRSVSEE